MQPITKLLASLCLIGVVVFCVYGFVATFEPPGWPLLRMVYAGVIAFCLALTVRLMLSAIKAWPR